MNRSAQGATSTPLSEARWPFSQVGPAGVRPWHRRNSLGVYTAQAFVDFRRDAISGF